MTLHTDRTFPFRVRPRHRETLDSLTRRVLTANGESASLRAHLTRELDLDTDKWGELLHRKNRTQARPPALSGVRHRDRTSCEQCPDLLTRRWMCTLCAHGERIEQEPHFGSPVCIRHGRWVGFGIPAEEQRAVSGEHIAAGVRFDKLRKRGRVDPRLYGLVSSQLITELDSTECAVFPQVVNLIKDITDTTFLKGLLDPRLSFVRAHQRLQSVVTRHGKRRLPATTRMPWLALRPVFAETRRVARTGGVYEAGHPHAFPMPSAVVAHIPQMPEREPFANFLARTGDTPATANASLGKAYSKLTPGARTHQHICGHGHTFTRAGATTEPTCPVCPRKGTAQVGVNDVASQSRKLAAQWDHASNRDLTPSMVSVSSSQPVAWLCRKGHSFVATPSNRFQNDQGCPVCLNRTILPGVNDFTSRFPAKFAELASGWVHRYKPHTHTATSKSVAEWECVNGHSFKASFASRAAGQTCLQCRRVSSVERRGSLAERHPELAAEWVTESNAKTPAD